MNIDSLKTFLTLAKTRNFTKTARKHSIVQSTVSARIKELERELNVQLFIRDQRSVTLTKAGSQFHAYAEQITRLECQAKDHLMTERMYPYHLRVGSAFTIYQSHLMTYMREYMALHDDVSIDIRVYDSMMAIENLNANAIDVCFSYAPFASGQIVCYPFRTEEMVIVTSHKNKEHQNGIRAADLRRLPLLITTFTLADAPLWYDELLGEYNMFALRTNAGPFILPMLQTGTYVSILPRSVVIDDLERGALVLIPLLDEEMPQVHTYILTKRRTMEQRPVADLLDICLGGQHGGEGSES